MTISEDKTTKVFNLEDSLNVVFKTELDNVCACFLFLTGG